MLDLAHLGYQICIGNQFFRSITSSNDYMHLRVALTQGIENLLCVEPSILERIGNLVQDHDIVEATLDLFAALLPASLSERTILFNILAHPGKPLPKRSYFDPHALSRTNLSPFTCLCLQEL